MLTLALDVLKLKLKAPIGASDGVIGGEIAIPPFPGRREGAVGTSIESEEVPGLNA